MIIGSIIVAFLAFSIPVSSQIRNHRSPDSVGNGRNKNYDLCSRVFDVSNSTIIKTSESLKNGAKYLASVQANTRDACERSCCSTETCNVAVLEEKSKTSTDGDCFLFDCGSLDNFKCIFAVHSSYVALGMMVNRVDLEKTRIHEQAKHEMDLKILKTPPVQAGAADVNSATVMPALNGNQRQLPPPPPIQQQWTDDQNIQPPVQQQPNPKMAGYQPDMDDPNVQQQPSENGGMPGYDYSQYQRPPPPPQQQQRKPNYDGRMQQNSRQRIPDRSPADSSGQFIPNGQQQQQTRERELHRKRPPVGENPAVQEEKIAKPKGLMDSRIDNPQRPPLYSDQSNRQKPKISCSAYQWACVSGDQCVAVYDRCSGIAQCQDGSDEENCDQVQNPINDASSDDGSNMNRNVQNPVQSKQQRPQQNAGSWSDSRDAMNNQQQRPPAVQDNSVRDNGDRQVQQRPQNGLMAKPSQSDLSSQGSGVGQLPEQPKRNQQPVANPEPPKPTELSSNKHSRVEFISIQKLDSSAATSGGESASLAVVMLGLGMAILALLLLYLSCRLRKVRRRLRRGKVLDTEEGEYLVNGMYL